MQVFELIIVLLLCGSALSALAIKMGAPYPVIVALGGALIALIPGVPAVTLDPELALALFIAPVLLDASYSTSPRDLERNWRSVLGLAVGAVIVTVVIVAIYAKTMVTEMSWWVAITLGAIVAPPDAIAATTVLRQLQIPHRLKVILEGESLFNDASALLVFRIAVAAALTGAVSGIGIVQTFLMMTAGSVLLGIVLAYAMIYVSSKIEDVSIAIVVQFCGTFAVWICAERLHLSGIITIVVFGMINARKVSSVLKARMRVPTWAVWQVAVFVLNVLAFVLVGFQVRLIVGRVSTSEAFHFILFAGGATLVAIFARILWVAFAGGMVAIHRSRKTSSKVDSKSAGELDARAMAVVGWSGMRGTVTLASALALPEGFPYRDLIFASAFVVTLGTLVIQGLTLKPFIKRLGLKEEEDVVQKEIMLARVVSLEAAIRKLNISERNTAIDVVIKSYEIQYAKAKFDLDNVDRSLSSEYERIPIVQEESNFLIGGIVLRSAIDEQRRSLLELRNGKTIGDEAYQALEEEIDWVELGWAQFLPQKDETKISTDSV